MERKGDVVLSFQDRVKLSKELDRVMKEGFQLRAALDKFLSEVGKPLDKFSLYVCDDERKEVAG